MPVDSGNKGNSADIIGIGSVKHLAFILLLLQLGDWKEGIYSRAGPRFI